MSSYWPREDPTALCSRAIRRLIFFREKPQVVTRWKTDAGQKILCFNPSDPEFQCCPAPQTMLRIDPENQIYFLSEPVSARMRSCESHLRLSSGLARIRTTTGSLSALARPTPYQALRQRLLHTKLLPTEAFTHRRFLHTYVFTQTLLHRHFYTQTQQKILHMDAFTHRHFYTETLLHTNTLHTNTFTQQTLLHADAVHTEAFTDKHFYAETLWHTNTLHRHFYTQKLYTDRDRRPDGSVGMALVLPALTDCGDGSNPCWSTREAQVRSAERQRAPTTEKETLHRRYYTHAFTRKSSHTRPGFALQQLWANSKSAIPQMTLTHRRY